MCGCFTFIQLAILLRVEIISNSLKEFVVTSFNWICTHSHNPDLDCEEGGYFHRKIQVGNSGLNKQKHISLGLLRAFNTLSLQEEV